MPATITKSKSQNSSSSAERAKMAEYEGQLAAISKSQAVIEFNLDGTILSANENFLKTVGYSLDEIKGRQHSLFADETYKNSPDYREHWAKLNRGEYISGEFKQISKGGKEVWIQASYNPIMDINGKPIKVVKYATDITAQVSLRNDASRFRVVVDDAVASIMMIDRNFTVTFANNSTFALLNKHVDTLRTAFPGFDPKKIVGASIDQFHKNPQHQRQLLSDPSRLPLETEIKIGPLSFSLRVTAVRDANGNYVGNSLEWKDVTAERLQAVLDADFRGQIAAISKGQAVIEFNLDGTILTANDNFLQTMGYSLDEIKGRHHSLFVDETYKNSLEYREFWAKLNRGESIPGEFKRIGKGGKEVWIQASYNPIMDINGKPIKVVKYANDITAQISLRNEASKYRVVVDDAVASIMMIDRNFTVTFANNSTFALLNKHVDTLRTAFPGFDPKKIVGASIDQFHKNPQHQRQLLSDPSRLPLETDIKIGPLSFSLRVTAVRDTNGNYVGNSLEWKDVTAERLQAAVLDADFRGQIAAISKGQAVIEFKLDGTIVTANENFLRALNYSLDEIQGRQHSMFVEEAYRLSPDYREHWAKLNRGEYIAGEFMRIGKGGKEVWVQASYNPIMDINGKPIKVVKYASDITAQVNAREEMKQILDKVNANASTLGSSAEELTAISTQMASNAEETAAQANVVSAASEQVSKNVQVVSTGVEEMNSAIREIAKNASDSARVSQQAVTDSQTANATISKLGDSSAEIGKVIKVITSIAEQTNLLALNATIEAARAGEAGKGFAVVANEVKELAKETARATEDISRKIEAIQGDTKGAVESIRQIGQVIAQINDISNTIATAVEEQTATATEMSRNVAEAAKGTAEIAQNITSVAQAAQNTTQGATNCQQAASELSRMATELQQLGAGKDTTSKRTGR